MVLSTFKGNVLREMTRLRPHCAVKVVLYLMLVVVHLTLFCGSATAQEPERSGTSEDQPPEAASLPGIADIVPYATQLVERESGLERSIAALFDLPATHERLSVLDKDVEDLTGRFKALESATTYQYDRISELKAAVLAKKQSLTTIVETLSQAISQLEAWKTTWLDEKKRLNEFKESMPKDLPADALKPAIAKARNSVDTALTVIARQLKPMLELQQQTVDIQYKMDSLEEALSAMLAAARTGAFQKSSPSMFSSKYYSEFRGVWDQLKRGIGAVPWLNRHFLALHGWKILLQALLVWLVITLITSHRTVLEAQERWQFLARRPVSVGLFVSAWIVSPLYGAVSRTWMVALWSVAGIAAARLLGSLTPDVWKRGSVYALALLVIMFQVFRLIDLPLPLSRLYVFLVALAGLFLCVRRALGSARRRESWSYTWVLRAASLILFVVVLSEIIGYSALASHVLESLLKTFFLILLVWMFMYLVRGGLQWLVYSSVLQKIPRLRGNETSAASRLTLLIGLLMFSIVAAYILVIWRAYESPLEAVQRVLALGFHAGSVRITLGMFIIVAVILYATFLVSWAVQGVLTEQVFPRRGVQSGVQASIARLIHYGLIFLGFLLALGALGLDFRNISIIGGALGVGIGFGLQSIVNNFVSGLILLFERPVKAGDYIQLGELWGEIKSIGLRATIVRTFDGSEIVVPNSDLISNQVTNWTLSNRAVRITIPVGVAYGSDVPLVMKTLKDCADDNPAVMNRPAPEVLFTRFGESSLDFELRIWVADVDNMVAVRSELHQEIDRTFRKAGIEIPFPQRDLHLRSVDRSAASGLFGPGTRSPA